MVAWKDTIGILTRDSRNIFPSFVSLRCIHNHEEEDERMRVKIIKIQIGDEIDTNL